MNSPKTAYLGCDIFDGQKRHKDMALLVKGTKVAGLVPIASLPADYRLVVMDCGLITPGFVDLQVNGGGGVMLNDAPTARTIQTICAAHLPFGTTALLPTLITDSFEQTQAAIGAAQTAISQAVPGIVGLHLEGPHLAPARKGAHEASLVRPMQQPDMELLQSAARSLPTLFTTVAPESVTQAQIATLSSAGAIVALGHSNATFDQASQAAENGARAVTHLFNAMSQITGREPGLVGAALNNGALSAGLIADGFHVDPASIALALRAKQRPGRIFLVTDAMATIGSEITEFPLNGRMIQRAEGRLTLADGTLAGADLDMISAVRFMHQTIGITLESALQMASYDPAWVIGRHKEIGSLTTGARADFLTLNKNVEITGVWQQGRRCL